MANYAQTHSPESMNSARVLVVDDEPPNRLYLRKLLESRGCIVWDTGEGVDALLLAVEHQPDLILADVMMPSMDGFELCERLGNEPKTKHIPIILVTAKSKVSDIETGFERGAMDYIRKPFNPRELVLRVRNALALKRSRDALRERALQEDRELVLARAIQRSQGFEESSTSFFEVQVVQQTDDAFDWIEFPDGRFCVYVAQFSGQGVEPILQAIRFKQLTREQILQDTAVDFSALCTVLQAIPTSSLFVALYEPKSRQWRCRNYGYPNPILVQKGTLDASALFEKEDSEVIFLSEPDSLLLFGAVLSIRQFGGAK